ncbi:hypothetical protein LTR50_001510 [Elasticomyces elasticus]|nr:hypothetical protein LTR50_001510 [Elasticomyces elasticus]
MEDNNPSAGHARRRSTSLLQSTAGAASRSHQYTHSRSGNTAQGANRDPATEESDSTRPSSSDLEMDDKHSDEDDEDDEETGLTKGDRRKATRRKRRNARLDERIAPAGDAGIAMAEKELAKQSFIRASIINALLIGSWYLFSISISIYNKWMFSKGNLDFHFPLFTTAVHMLVQFSLASCVMYFLPHLRPGNSPVIDLHASSSHQYQEIRNVSSDSSPHSPNDAVKKPLITRWFYLTRISPCGIATGLDIGFGNMSLKYITLTFYTMCKSSVLAFVLFFALLFRLERPSWKLGGIIATMTAGVLMMVAGETAFNALGFALVLSAAFFSGFRWSLTQILLLRSPATSNPFSSIFFLAPVMFLSLLVIALPVEGASELRAGFAALAQAKGHALAVLILLFPGVLAFCMTASEFALLKRTSVVTLSICGIFKEVVTISAAGLVFGDTLTPINISGLLVTIASIAAYNYIKIAKMRQEATRDARVLVEGDAAAGTEFSGKGEDEEGGMSVAGAADLRGGSVDADRGVDAVDKERRGSVERDRDRDAGVTT